MEAAESSHWSREYTASREQCPAFALSPRPPSQPSFTAHLTSACSASPRPRPFVPKIGIGHDSAHEASEHTHQGLLQKPRHQSRASPGMLHLAAFVASFIFFHCLSLRLLFTNVLEMAFLFCTNSCTFMREIYESPFLNLKGTFFFKTQPVKLLIQMGLMVSRKPLTWKEHVYSSCMFSFNYY